MARARNIKPGFYKNEDLAECSIWARFIFPGLWMLADREGRLEDRPKRIKGELLPFDSEEVEPLLNELKTRGFILRYEVEGKGYIQILAFHKHQTPHHKEQESVISSPQSPGLSSVATIQKTGASLVLHKTKTQDMPEANPRQTQDMPEANPGQTQGNDLMQGGVNPSDSLIPDSLIPDSLNLNPDTAVTTAMVAAAHPGIDHCPHQQIIDAYHEILPACTPVKVWNDTRKGLLRQRWREDTRRQRIEWWRKLFGYIAESRFLTGQTDPPPGRATFVADLEWIIKPQNFAKIIEGKYHENEAATA